MIEFKDALRPDCHFKSVVATKYGIPAALIFSRIQWSITKHYDAKDDQYFLKDKWWMYDTAETFHESFPFLSVPTIKRAMAELSKAGLILRLRVRAKNWNQTNFYSINYEEYKKLAYQNDTVANNGDKASVSKRYDREDQFDTIERINLIPSSLSKNLTKSLTKREGGKSPANQSQNQEKKTESETGISELSPELSNEPPDEGKLLAIDWLRRTDRLARMRGLTESEILGEIVKLATKYSLAELRQIFEYLESSPVNSKICKEFITPFEASNIFRLTGMTMIEQAYIEAYESPEGKILLKKKNETKPKETPKFLENIMQREEKKLNEKIRLMKEQQGLSAGKGRLCLKAYPI